MQVYHGSKKLTKSDLIEYTGGSRFNKGFGLYCTTSYDWANLYGKTVNCITLDICSSQEASTIEIPMKHWLSWIERNCTKKFYSTIVKEFSERTVMSVARMEVMIINYIRNVKKIAPAFAQFVSAHGCTHALDSGDYNSKLIRIYDFKCIKSTCKSTTYNDTILPEDYFKELA